MAAVPSLSPPLGWQALFVVRGVHSQTLSGLEPDVKQRICCAKSHDSGSHETLEALQIDGWEEADVPS